jgi:hypothetical protein
MSDWNRPLDAAHRRREMDEAEEARRRGAAAVELARLHRESSGAAGPPSDEAPASGRDWYDEVLRLRAALASAEQRARTQALEEAIRLAEARANHYDCESEPDCWAIADAIRSLLLGASPEGRGSATP